jgi:hypothetical protein
MPRFMVSELERISASQTVQIYAFGAPSESDESRISATTILCCNTWQQTLAAIGRLLTQPAMRKF